MPRSEFNVQHKQGVFRVFKDYTIVHGNTWLRPRMQTSQRTLYFLKNFVVVNNSRPCMELFSGDGEPDIRERPFEELPGLENFNDLYRRNGGVVRPLVDGFKLMYRVEGLTIYRSFRICYPAMTMVTAVINQFIHPHLVSISFFFITTGDTPSRSSNRFIRHTRLDFHYNITHPI